MLSDLESIERRIVQIRKRATGKDKEALAILPVMEKALELLQNGQPVRLMLKDISPEDLLTLKGLNSFSPPSRCSYVSTLPKVTRQTAMRSAPLSTRWPKNRRADGYHFRRHRGRSRAASR